MCVKNLRFLRAMVVSQEEQLQETATGQRSVSGHVFSIRGKGGNVGRDSSVEVKVQSACHLC